MFTYLYEHPTGYPSIQQCQLISLRVKETNKPIYLLRAIHVDYALRILIVNRNYSAVNHLVFVQEYIFQLSNSKALLSVPLNHNLIAMAQLLIDSQCRH